MRQREARSGFLASSIASCLVLLIRIYQRLISPLIGPTCRFHPTCSAYAIEAIRLNGPVRGVGRAIARLSRCHPWTDGGYDPVR